jgi:hypothetical protein
MMGTVRAGGEKLKFVTDQRVDNPESLEGHEGHYVRVEAHAHADQRFDSHHRIEAVYGK